MVTKIILIYQIRHFKSKSTLCLFFPYFNAFFLNSATIIDQWLWPELFAAYERTYLPGSKTAVFYNAASYFRVIRTQLNRILPPNLLKERLMLECRALQFPVFHFLFDVFDRKLQEYFEANLIDYNSRKWKELHDLEQYQEFREPFAVLTLDELEAGFVVCLLPLVFSVTIFFFEWLQNLKDFLVCLHILNEYLILRKIDQDNLAKVMKKNIYSLLCSRVPNTRLVEEVNASEYN